jgi:asparagine synthase (glutamine-hydrolysing)
MRSMVVPDSSLALGSPRFEDPRLATIARSHGPLAAWRETVALDPAQAAAGVTGEFAIGLHRAGGNAFLAVDRFAVHTLCYRIVDGALHFAARADDLADADTPVDPQAIFDYLYFHVIPSPRTIYRGIFRLPPGHYAWFHNGQLTVAPYWQPVFHEHQDTPRELLRNEFRKLLLDSVESQLDGGKPACFLSGGTDSSTIAGMATRARGNTVATYSIGFDAQGYDEMAFASMVAKHFGTEHHAYYVTPQDLVRSIPAVAAHFDQPFGNSSALPAYYCAKKAQEDGVSKLLAGDGGDELFGGNARYAKQRMFSWYGHVPQMLKARVMEPLLGAHAAQSFALTRKAGSYVEQARVPMPERLQMYNLIMRLGANEVLTPQLLAQVDTTSPLQTQRQVWQRPHRCSHLNQELAFDWRFTLAESDLPKVRGAAALAGIGVGFPMLDYRLLAFSQKLPTSYKLKGLQLRWFFKDALRGFLPDAVIAKKKQGFGLPFGVWATTHSPLLSLASSSLHSLAGRGVIRSEFVQSLLAHRLPEHPGYFGEMVWILMMLEQWLQAHAPHFAVDA